MYGVNKINWRRNESFTDNVEIKSKEVFYNFSNDIKEDGEVLWSNSKELSKYKGSEVIIFGGGPSSKHYLTHQFIPTGTYVWAMNHFFTNKFLMKAQPDLITLNPESWTAQTIFSHDPFIGLELHHHWSDDSSTDALHAVNNWYNNRYKFTFSTKYYSQLGAGARLCLLAAALGVKKVYFIGFDGPKALLNKEHSFISSEKMQKRFPSALAGLNDEQVISRMKQQWKEFWLYISKQYNTEFESLQKNNDNHKIVGELWKE